MIYFDLVKQTQLHFVYFCNRKNPGNKVKCGGSLHFKVKIVFTKSPYLFNSHQISKISILHTNQNPHINFTKTVKINKTKFEIKFDKTLNFQPIHYFSNTQKSQISPKNHQNILFYNTFTNSTNIIRNNAF